MDETNLRKAMLFVLLSVTAIKDVVKEKILYVYKRGVL
jgi:hypothetical protein